MDAKQYQIVIHNLMPRRRAKLISRFHECLRRWQHKKTAHNYRMALSAVRECRKHERKWWKSIHSQVGNGLARIQRELKEKAD